jgi:hypothetical protein
MKCYHTDDVAAAIAGVDEKTWREKCWFYMKGLAQLDMVMNMLLSLL